jgi:uncharacterized membrane protein
MISSDSRKNFRLLILDFRKNTMIKSKISNIKYFAVFLFVFCILVLIFVSLLSPKPASEKITGLTYATTVKKDKLRSRASWNSLDIILSGIVILVIVAIRVYFSPLGISQ